MGNDKDGLLNSKLECLAGRIQVVVLELLPSRLLMLPHSNELSGHPEQNRMFYILSKTYR